MGRRKHHEEPENHERWLVSYADFITLLFAFFVVMYSVSSINDGKFRVLSDVLVAAFRAPAQTMMPIQFGRPVRAPSSGLSDPRFKRPKFIPDLRPVPSSSGPRIRRPSLTHFIQTRKQEAAPVDDGAKSKPGKVTFASEPKGDEVDKGDTLDGIVARLQAALPDLINADLVRVRRNANLVEVEIGDNVLFPSGSAAINNSALEPLKAIATVLKEVPNPIQVEGFTDNIPIKNQVFPSNWELSAGRAASVVHVLMEAGVRPERMAAIGYGEHRPIADNASEEGRNRNRRVVLVIQGDDSPQPNDKGPKRKSAELAAAHSGVASTH